MASNPPDMRRRDDGYAMAALLVAMAVMTVMMTAAMPVWKTMAQREKEAELIFRGQQYARAIGLYQRKLGPGTLPPNLDILIDQKFLRKKYKDPITNDDFQLLSAGQTAARPGQQVGEGQTALAQQRLSQAAGQLGAGRLGQAGPVIGGITGVASKSTATSLRLYNNRDKYNEWTFVFVQSAQSPGSQTPGGLGPGGRGRGARGAQGPARPGAGPVTPGSGPQRGPRGGQPPQLPVDRRVF